MTIIIPTLNEAPQLPATVRALRERAEAPEQLEILLVDAGSEDGTVEVARQLGLTVFSRPDFRYQRYRSLQLGLEEAGHDAVLFLDADTLVPPAFDHLIREKLGEQDCVGGAFEFALDAQGWLWSIITLINRVRYRWHPIYHGDQGMFCRRKVALQLGGIPHEPLMEIAYFCRTLRSAGRLCLIKAPAVTSARRFTQHGPWRVIWFDVRMWLRFITGRPVAPFAIRYWTKT